MALVNAFDALNLEATQLQVRDYLDTVELKLQSIRDRLDGAMALDSATLTALETINAIVSGSVDVSNMIPAIETGLAKDTTLGARASETKLEAVRALLAATLQVVGVVALDTNTLAALETIQVGNFPVSQAVTGPLTDAQLRAFAVPVSGTVAVTEPVTVDGSVSVTNPTANPETGLAKEATALRRYGGGKTPVSATVTSLGDTIIHTPAAGKKIRLSWVSAINDPDESTVPLISVKLGALEIYRAYAVAHWEPFEGAVDAPLIISLSSAASVAVTAHIEEM